MHTAAMASHTTNRALVVGLGITGLACVRHLVRLSHAVTVVDSRESPPMLNELRREFPGVPVHLGAFQEGLFSRAELLVVSPGVSVREPAIAHAVAGGNRAIGDIELFAQAARAPVLAVTGANGKSTVTALLGAMCREGGSVTAIGGNIGVPALSLLTQPEPDLYVLELSSFQLETTYSLNARAAAVLNVTPDHLDRYRDLEEYAAAKARIFAGDGTQVLNADDPLVMRMACAGRRVVHFGLGPPVGPADFGIVERDGEPWLANGSHAIMPARDVPVPGRHNIANVLAAMALARTVDVPLDACRAAAQKFRGLPHRTELVAERDGVRWINDSKGTNVGATLAALSGMTAPVVLIAGGDGKGADFGELKEAVAGHARAVVLIGADAPLIEAALQGAVPVRHAKDLRGAVQAAKRLARPGDIVLLSPACASWDMFRNYEHRGDMFKAIVREVAI